MTDGIFISGQRPKSKKQVLEAIRNAPETVTIEKTSLFDGGGTVPFAEYRNGALVGPDPYTNRKFYLSVSNGKVS